jgi:hypothetical protein
MPKKYRVSATVCDTIRSTPVDMTQAKRMQKETKRRIPKAKVKIGKA